MSNYQIHPCERVQAALIKLCDEICEWERSTGRTSALIFREKGGFVFRAHSGKPVFLDETELADAQLVLTETQ